MTITNKTIEYLKEKVRDSKGSIEMWEEQLDKVDEVFIGEALEKETKKLEKWIFEERVELEAFEKYLDEIEMQIRQGEEHDKEQEILAQAKAEDDRVEQAEQEMLDKEEILQANRMQNEDN